jgi:uncharacterized protein
MHVDHRLANEVARALNPRVLNLILLPTEQCNFRCTYCYEDFKQGAMPAWVVSAIKQLMATRAPGLDELRIAWFGGEPLLASRIICDISQFVQSLQREHPGLRYSGSMATNAALLDAERLATMVACGVTSYQITLDGPAELHNQTRVTRRGSGTFEQIWRHLLGIRNSGFDVAVTLRLHYQADTFTRLFPLIELLNRELAGDERFRVHFKSVARLGGPNDAMIQPVGLQEQRSVEAMLRAMLRFPDQALSFDDYVCYAGAANSLIIRANGDLNKCTVALSDDANRIGRLNPDGSLTVEQVKFRRWVDALLSDDPDVMGCPLSYVLERAQPAVGAVA